MDINGVIDLAKRVAAAERMDFGAASTREQRNAMWERIVGICHHGHPIYNKTGADPQWHIKDPDAIGSGRPQSDDVVVSMPSQNFWDCIPNAGAAGWRFEAAFHGPLHGQTIYPPAKPDPRGVEGGGGDPPVDPKPTSVPPYPGDEWGFKLGGWIFADYAEAGQAPNPGMGVWFMRATYDFLASKFPGGKGWTLEEAAKAHRNEMRRILGLAPLP